MTTAVDYVRSFRHLRALVIGDVMLDSYLEGSATRLCREGPVPVVRKAAEEHSPGGAANTAANLRALGAEVFLLGLTGRDIASTLLRDALEKRGVEAHRLVADETIATLHKQRILSDDQYVVRFDSGETRYPSPVARERLHRTLSDVFPLCDLVVISDYRYGVITDELLTMLRSLREDRPCVLAVDSKDLGRFSTVGATIATPNHFEAYLAVEPASTPEGGIDLADVDRIARLLLARIETEHVAVTLAGDGVLLASRNGAVSHLPAHPVAHANDVGAGDSFTAAIALSLAAGAPPREAAQIAIDAGSIAVTQRRTAVVQHQELLQRVSLLSQDRTPSAREVAILLQESRYLGKRIVFTNGVFDILHAGHVHFLRAAKSLGDVLVVGINSDRSARRLKGRNRPIISERDRMSLVAALDPVDHVLLFDEDTPSGVIRTLRPHIHVKGGDYAGEALPEADAVHDVGGRVVILPLVESMSTSTVIERIVAMALDGRAPEEVERTSGPGDMPQVVVAETGGAS